MGLGSAQLQRSVCTRYYSYMMRRFIFPSEIAFACHNRPPDGTHLEDDAQRAKLTGRRRRNGAGGAVRAVYPAPKTAWIHTCMCLDTRRLYVHVFWL